MIYKITYTDKSGDVTDAAYCCSFGCSCTLDQHLRSLESVGKIEIGIVSDVDESDNDTYCVSCGELIRKGIGR